MHQQQSTPDVPPSLTRWRFSLSSLPHHILSPQTPTRSLGLRIFLIFSILSLQHPSTCDMEALLALLLCALAAASTSTSTPPSSSTSSTTEGWTSSTTTGQSTSTTTATKTTEWRDMEEGESDKLVDFVVSEIQKLKMEHRELSDCQELNLSSVLSGKKLSGKITKYSVTLKVQPQVKNSEICLQKNETLSNMHPEICEADVTEGDHGGTEGKTLLRSTCLQVEELQD